MCTSLWPTNRCDSIALTKVYKLSDFAATCRPNVDTVWETDCEVIYRGPVHQIQIEVILKCGSIQNFERYLGNLTLASLWNDNLILIKAAQRVMLESHSWEGAACQGVVRVHILWENRLLPKRRRTHERCSGWSSSHWKDIIPRWFLVRVGVLWAIWEQLAEASRFAVCQAIVELVRDLRAVELENCEFWVERRCLARNSASFVGRHIHIRAPLLLTNRWVVETRSLLLGVEIGVTAELVRVMNLMD